MIAPSKKNNSNNKRLRFQKLIIRVIVEISKFSESAEQRFEETSNLLLRGKERHCEAVGINKKNMASCKNKIEGMSMVFTSFESHLFYVVLNSWWIDIGASIHVSIS